MGGAAMNKELLYKAEKNRLEYWREQMESATPGSEIEKMCRRMIDLHEERLAMLEGRKDGEKDDG